MLNNIFILAKQVLVQKQQLTVEQMALAIQVFFLPALNLDGFNHNSSWQSEVQKLQSNINPTWKAIPKKA